MVPVVRPLKKEGFIYRYFLLNIEGVREALIEWENLSTDKKNRAEYEARLKELRDQLFNL